MSLAAEASLDPSFDLFPRLELGSAFLDFGNPTFNLLRPRSFRAGIAGAVKARQEFCRQLGAGIDLELEGLCQHGLCCSGHGTILRCK